MKNLFILFVAVFATASTTLTGQHLAVFNHDFIGFAKYPATPFVMKAEDNHFYFITGSNFESLAHPLLGEVYNDFASLIFMKYDPSGKALWEKHIFGYSNIYFRNAAVQENNLVVFGNSGGNVEIEGSLIPINNGYTLEFISKYDPDGNLIKFASIWSPTLDYPYSDMAVSQVDGSIYVYGTYASPLTLENATVIGEKWLDGYFYVIKYNRNLSFEWAFTTGFATEPDGYGSFNNLLVTPDKQGNILLTGNYQSSLSRPVFGNDTLPESSYALGMFIYLLSGQAEPVWSTYGTQYESTYGAGIYETFSMSNGDYILATTCNTGHMKLSDAEIVFENHNYMENHVVMRMDKNGKILWTRPIQSMGYNYEGKSGRDGKIGESSPDKGAKSDKFSTFIYKDAAMLNEDRIYITGHSNIDSMVVAGEKLPNEYGNALFLVSLDASDGSELWGHTVSSNYTDLFGFDLDPYGNAVLAGGSNSPMVVRGLEPRSYQSIDGYFQFHTGVDKSGKPLWLTGAYTESGSYELQSTDVALLENGTVVAPYYMTNADYVIIEGQRFIYDFSYLNYLFLFQSPNVVSGKVITADEQPVYPGQVKAIMEIGSGAFPFTDSVQIGDDGSFYFSDLFPGNYTFRVEASQDVYPDAKLTYLGDQVTWNDAVFIPVGATDTIGDLGIVLQEIPAFTADQGKGEVAGNVSYADEGTKTLGRPVKKVTVVLLSKTKKSSMETISAVVETDDYGNYFIQNIPDGSYTMTVDIPGLGMVRTYNVTIIGSQIYSGLDFIVDVENGIDIIWGVNVEINPVRTVHLYPNPGNGVIYLEGELDKDVYVTVYSTDAKMVMTEHIDGLSESVIIDMGELGPGIYFIKVESRNLNNMIKYILQ